MVLPKLRGTLAYPSRKGQHPHNTRPLRIMLVEALTWDPTNKNFNKHLIGNKIKRTSQALSSHTTKVQDNLSCIEVSMNKCPYDIITITIRQTNPRYYPEALSSHVPPRAFQGCEMVNVLRPTSALRNSNEGIVFWQK